MVGCWLFFFTIVYVVEQPRSRLKANIKPKPLDENFQAIPERDKLKDV